MKQRILLPVMLLLAIACGKSNDDESTSSNVPDNALTEAYAAVTSQMDNISQLSPAGSSSKIVNSLTKSMLAAPAFGTDWDTTTPCPDDRTANGTPNISIKEWMGLQISDDAVRDNGSKIGVLGRLRNNLEVFCAIGIGLGNLSGDGYPENGTQSVTFTQAKIDEIESNCDMDLSDIEVGFEMDFTIADASTTTVYDKTITINPVPGGGSQTIYLRSTATEVNIGSVETYTIDSVPRVSRTILQFDVTSGTYRGEYISGPNEAIQAGGRVEGWRVLWDALNVEAYMLARMHEHGDNPTKFSVSGKPNTSGSNISLSFVSDFVGDTDERKICVAEATGNAVSDGSVCSAVSGVSVAGLDIDDASALDVFDDTFDGSNYATIDDGDLTFTKTNINTAAFAQD